MARVVSANSTGYVPMRLPKQDGPCFVTMSRPDEVAIGVLLGEDYHYVADTAKDAIDSAWRVLDSACKALEKANKPIPRDVVSAMGLLRPWVKE
jgi:hypothetical protein